MRARRDRPAAARCGALLLVIALLLGGCLSKPPRGGAGQGGVVQLRGSDTMVNLGQAWADQFMRENPGMTVAVTGGGSGTGIAALLNRTANIAQSSRRVTPAEIERARRNGFALREFLVGKDGLAVIVHPSNPVVSLTYEQLRRIFTGAATNWKDVGGADLPIVVMSREVNSGTHVYFKEEVLQNAEFSPRALLMPSSQAIADGVAADRGAIGYLGMAYVSPSVRALRIAKRPGGEAVEPSEANVLAGRYPISRPLFLYTAGDPTGPIQGFIDFALSPQGQAIVQKVGFTPLKK